ncbi:MAG TPA: sortase [Ilumatobacter sp.]|nr:sortase [Ilumatobacter sp.]
MTDRIADLDPVSGGVTDDTAIARGGHTDLETGADRTAAAGTAPSSAPTSWWGRRRERRRTRVSKWDRPPDPRDWRFFVGTLGKVLIATGILMFGFVAYQLWGTGIETARAQNRLADAFEQAIAASDDVAPERVPDRVPDDEVDESVPDTTAVDEPDAPAEVDDGLPELPDPVPSAVVPGGVDLSDLAVDQEIPVIDRGDVIARLQIPKIDQDLYVVAGVTLDDLKDGPGHYDDTPLPGQLGNAAIAGHRTTYGAPFFDVDQLTAGDQLIVTMITGDRFVYEVTGVQIVSASDYWVVTTRDPNVAELTLTSCHPKYTARDRIVVHSVLVPELSANVGVAESYTLSDSTSGAIPGDDPTLAADEPTVTAPTVTAPTVTAPPVTAPTVTEPPATAPVVANEDAPAAPVVSSPARAAAGDLPTAPDPGTLEEPERIDAFSQGWFDDGEAWPQIALWGLALTIISLLAYQVSKRTRHDSIGFLVGIGPFLFCLYFFFQNVNRLLPPGL